MRRGPGYRHARMRPLRFWRYGANDDQSDPGGRAGFVQSQNADVHVQEAGAGLFIHRRPIPHQSGEITHRFFRKAHYL